jgi:hypothetical protein
LRSLLGQSFFPHLVAEPFMNGLRRAFYLSEVMCAIAALSSFLGGSAPHALGEEKP